VQCTNAAGLLCGMLGSVTLAGDGVSSLTLPHIRSVPQTLAFGALCNYLLWLKSYPLFIATRGLG
jgi:hypothetical protein